MYGKITPILFIFQPFVSFVLSFRNLNDRSNLIIFVLFSSLFGYSITFSYPPSDCYRIAASFCTYPINSINDILLLKEQGKLVDLYLVVANYIVHKISDNPKVLYALLGGVYGLFCGLSMRILIKDRKGKDNMYLLVILLLFFTTSSLANMSMPRFWTAAWLFFYSSIRILERKSRWIIGAACCPLLHFSFITPFIVVLIFSINLSYWKSKIELLYLITIISFVFSFLLNEGVLQYLIPFDIVNSNEKMQAKVSAYIAEENVLYSTNEITTSYRQANAFVTNLFQIFVKIGAMLILLVIKRNMNKLNIDNFLFKLFVFVLLLASCCFFMSIIRSVGWRYISLLWLFLLYLLYKIYDKNRTSYWERIILSILPIYIYNISFMFYLTYRVVDIMLFFAPFPFVIYEGLDFGPVFF